MLAPLVVLEVVVLEMALSCDWQPVVVALAAAIGLLAPALVNVLLSLAHGAALRDNRAAIGRVEQQTNGELVSLRAENVRLKTMIDDHADGVHPPHT